MKKEKKHLIEIPDQTYNEIEQIAKSKGVSVEDVTELMIGVFAKVLNNADTEVKKLLKETKIKVKKQDD